MTTIDTERMKRDIEFRNEPHDSSKLGRILDLVQCYENLAQCYENVDDTASEEWGEEFYEAVYEVAVHDAKIEDLRIEHAEDI